MPHKAARQRLVGQWIRKAEEDFHVVELLRVDGDRLGGAIMFHAQQCVEKYLKAYLTSRQVDFPKTHDIEHLRQLIARLDCTFAEKIRDAAILTLYAVDARYPGEEQIPGAEGVHEALAQMNLVRSACRAVLDACEGDRRGNR